MTSQAAPGRGVRRLAVIGIVTYALALLATLPAAAVLPKTGTLQNASGTVWNGSAAIGGGNALRWHWAPLKSLARGGLAADWTVDGPGTALAGIAQGWPGAAAVDAVSGRADWALITRLAPALPVTCDIALTVRNLRAARDRFAGEIIGDPGRCGPSGSGPASPVPRLLGTATDNGTRSTLVLTPWGARADRLVEVTLGRDRKLMARITPRGAALFGGAFPAGGATLETTM